MTTRNSFDPEARYAALEQRVYGLEQGVATLNTNFNNAIGDVKATLSGLASKLDERSKTPWATIVSAMGVVLAIVVAGGQLAKAPIDQAIVRLERDVGNTTPIDRFNEFKATYENNRVVGRQDFDSKVAALQNSITTLAGQLVPRGEHEEKWRGFDRTIGDIQRQVDEEKKAFGDTYSLRDTILDLKTRLDRTEAELARVKPVGTP